jgi:hypothetical protein
VDLSGLREHLRGTTARSAVPRSIRSLCCAC